jgi:hypothetical protein
MKKLLLLLLSAAWCSAATITTNIVHSSVSLGPDGLYSYSYQIRPSEVDRRDLSYFEVFHCEEARIMNPEATLNFKLNQQEYSVKWEDLPSNNNSQTITFSFKSSYTPHENGRLEFKIANKTWSQGNVITPGCTSIPETSSTLLTALGCVFLLRRKR